MSTVALECHINAGKDQVWNIIADLGGVSKFHPFVGNSYTVGEQKEGVNATRVCEFDNGMTVEEKAIRWQSGNSMTLAIAFKKGAKPPISGMMGTLVVREAETGTIVRMEMEYQPRFGLIGHIMDHFMIRSQYAKMLKGILAGLKHHAETGETIEGAVARQLLATAA